MVKNFFNRFARILRLHRLVSSFFVTLSCCVFLVWQQNQNFSMQSLATKDSSLVLQNEPLSEKCRDNEVVLSIILDSRQAWKGDKKCSEFTISHMIPHCRVPRALASYPGSGNTWLRYLIEGAGGIFTGSRYKDLQIQMLGFWGEIRNWHDGTTIVQKTHDASKHHVLNEFHGDGILLLRNPYDAILSSHNYLYAGHHGKAPVENYKRPEWPQFLAIHASKWLDMASNWTLHSNRHKVLVVHYEDLKSDVKTELEKILNFLKIPVDHKRLACLESHSRGLFRRSESTSVDTVNPFPLSIRRQMDAMIRHVDEKILKRHGFTRMPLHRYNFFNKTDEEIFEELQMNSIRQKNITYVNDNSIQIDKVHGTEMILKEYFKYLDAKEKLAQQGETPPPDDTATLIMRYVYEALGKPKEGESLRSVAEKAEGILSAVIDWWPKIQKHIAKDPILEDIETDAYRGKEIKDLELPE